MFESSEILQQDILATRVVGSTQGPNGGHTGDNYGVNYGNGIHGNGIRGLHRICAGSPAAVKVATVKALNRMRIKVASIGKDVDHDVIIAMSGERRVEVRVEPVGAKSARMKISAHQGETADIRTATEIVAHTEHLLANPV